MANSGFAHLTGPLNERFVDQFGSVDYVVCPSGSCTLHLKEHLHSQANEPAATAIRQHVYELTEFITDVLKVDSIKARFPYRVGMHQSCHGQRGLHLSQMSELNAPAFSKPGQLLRQVADIELITLDRVDECCGFGGTFCVVEEAVSAKMGKDRVADHLRHGADYITGVDMSCLMHMEGILNRQGSKTKVVHIAEILNNS
jgi:L-lactate dehydrogenase complex protein LldE